MSAAGEQASPLLEVRGLVKQFGGLKAIDGLDLNLAPGELRCLIGPNGAGKSTFFKLLLGLHKPTTGSIRYKGEDVTALEPFERARRGISIKFQVPGIYPDLTIRQNVRLAVQLHAPRGAIDAEIDRLLEETTLGGLAATRAGHLSHGQQQWLEVGMAIASKPDLLLLDEPTAGMSPEETAKTAEIVRGLNAKGMAIMIIEHDMAFVRQVARTVTVLHYGKVFDEGSLSQIESNADVVRIYLGQV